jgi:hypothetical protein
MVLYIWYCIYISLHPDDRERVPPSPLRTSFAAGGLVSSLELFHLCQRSCQSSVTNFSFVKVYSLLIRRIYFRRYRRSTTPYRRFIYIYLFLSVQVKFFWIVFYIVNDPSAGSPTETLLRLLLPLNDQVWSSSR